MRQNPLQEKLILHYNAYIIWLYISQNWTNIFYYIHRIIRHTVLLLFKNIISIKNNHMEVR